MEKKRKIHPFVILFLLAIFALNLIVFLRGKGAMYNSLTGMFIQDIPSNINLGLLAFIIQWVILLFVVILAYMKFLKHRKEEDQKVEHFIIPSPKSKAETNLDVLYNLLMEKKSLSIRTISRLFNIPKEKALEWSKILEDQDLVSIEYPAFSDAEVKIKQDEEEKLRQSK